MSTNPNKLSQFWLELKRRKVVRVIMVYAATAFVILELVDIITEPFGLPDWTLRFVVVILSVGFIVSVIFSWIYDIHPEGGIVKTEPANKVKEEEKPVTSKNWMIASYISFLVIVFLIILHLISSSNKSREIANLEKSIAVLPFENWDSDEEYLHLGDAITDEIIMQLQYIKEFDRVLSRSSTMQYKSNRPSIPEIGTQLGVNYIIEGSIQRQKDNVSIRVQVIRAIHEDHIWAMEYEGKWADIYTIQDDIAKNVARQLKIVLSQNEIEQIEKKPTENLEAYNYYLQANYYYWRSYEKQDWTLAINLYKLALELDSTFALAYTQLARSYIQLYWFHFDKTKNCLHKARQAIDAAFRIEPDFADANLSLGAYYYQGFLDYDKALTYLEKALAEMPNNAECIHFIASVYRRMGSFEKAKEEFNKAYKNDPKNSRVVYNTAQTYYLLGEYPEALNYTDITLNLSPEFANAYLQKIDIYLKWEGDTKNGRKVLQEASSHINPSSSPILAEKAVLMDIYEGHYQNAINYLNTINFEAFQNQFYFYPKYLYYAFVFECMKDTDRAEIFYDISRLILEDKITLFPEDSRLHSSLGICYAGLGEKEKAIAAGRQGTDILPISKESWRGYYRLLELAQIYVMTGEYEMAIEQLDFLLSVPGILSPQLIQLETRWRPLLDHPEFVRLTEIYAEK